MKLFFIAAYFLTHLTEAARSAQQPCSFLRPVSTVCFARGGRASVVSNTSIQAEPERQPAIRRVRQSRSLESNNCPSSCPAEDGESEHPTLAASEAENAVLPYSAKDIRILEGLDAVRMRPGAFLFSAVLIFAMCLREAESRVK